MSITLHSVPSCSACLAIARRVVLNMLLAYSIAAGVTFAMILAGEVMSPSDQNPYIGQAIGGTTWTIAWLSIGSPAVLFVLVGLDWGLRHAARQRLAGMCASLGPAALLAVTCVLDGLGMSDALSYVLWLLLVGLAFGQLMLLPPTELPGLGRQKR